ncbi:uncharacterized protein LOC143069295 [Mytilus galloprovincialis]|uniref:uncharacterized protein LOC143069295 n=1 Tax=Mytilus galloprovincialis TaxID=29158 RepID=UPI003F7C28E6
MAGVVYDYLSFVANDVIFFSDDVQTTTIAVAIASSLCCSIVWAVFHIINVVQPSKGTVKAKSATLSIYAGKIHASRKSCQPVCLDGSVTLQQDEVEVPCVRCGKYYADANCRFVTCKECCFSVTACNFHRLNKDIKVRQYRSDGQQQLQEIDLSQCQIQQCPERLGFVGAQLTLLNLAQNKLTNLPSEIGCLRGLTDLFIDHNNITIIPDSLGSLVNLESLNLSFNQIYTLPDTICSLQNLKVLKADHNNMEDIPKCIGQLHRLVKLYLEYNKLEYFNIKCSSLGHLEILVLNNNPISSLPDEIRNMIHLHELDVSSCDLHNIPKSICYCPNLATLNLSNNQLSVIPVEIGRLPSLKNLQLNNNKLQYIPSTLKVDKYNSISVSGNPFLLEDSLIEVYTPNNLFPSLLEKALRFVCNHGNYKIDILPQTLQDILTEIKTCTGCGQIFFTYYKSTIELQQTTQGTIPFYSQICSPHNTQMCNQT